jgi:hypothetical protein
MSLLDDLSTGATDIFGVVDSTSSSVSTTADNIASAESGLGALLGTTGNNPLAQAAAPTTVAAQQAVQPGSVPAGSLFASDSINRMFAGLKSNPQTMLLLLGAVVVLFFVLRA